MFSSNIFETNMNHYIDEIRATLQSQYLQAIVGFVQYHKLEFNITFLIYMLIANV